MNMKKQRVLKKLSSFVLILIVIGCIYTVSLFIKPLQSHTFYFVSYSWNIQSEHHNIIKNPPIQYIIEEYFSGPINRKKFPLYLYKTENLDTYYIFDTSLRISLTEKGMEQFNRYNENQHKILAKAFIKTMNTFNDLSHLTTVEYYFEKRLLLFSYTLVED